jgi:hypothetical protein
MAISSPQLQGPSAQPLDWQAAYAAGAGFSNQVRKLRNTDAADTHFDTLYTQFGENPRAMYEYLHDDRVPFTERLRGFGWSRRRGLGLPRSWAESPWTQNNEAAVGAYLDQYYTEEKPMGEGAATTPASAAIDGSEKPQFVPEEVPGKGEMLRQEQILPEEEREDYGGGGGDEGPVSIGERETQIDRGGAAREAARGETIGLSEEESQERQEALALQDQVYADAHSETITAGESADVLVPAANEAYAEIVAALEGLEGTELVRVLDEWLGTQSIGLPGVSDGDGRSGESGLLQEALYDALESAGIVPTGIEGGEARRNLRGAINQIKRQLADDGIIPSQVELGTLRMRAAEEDAAAAAAAEQQAEADTRQDEMLSDPFQQVRPDQRGIEGATENDLQSDSRIPGTEIGPAGPRTAEVASDVSPSQGAPAEVTDRRGEDTGAMLTRMFEEGQAIGRQQAGEGLAQVATTRQQKMEEQLQIEQNARALRRAQKFEELARRGMTPEIAEQIVDHEFQQETMRVEAHAQEVAAAREALAAMSPQDRVAFVANADNQAVMEEAQTFFERNPEAGGTRTRLTDPQTGRPVEAFVLPDGNIVRLNTKADMVAATHLQNLGNPQADPNQRRAAEGFVKGTIRANAETAREVLADTAPTQQVLRHNNELVDRALEMWRENPENAMIMFPLLAAEWNNGLVATTAVRQQAADLALTEAQTAHYTEQARQMQIATDQYLRQYERFGPMMDELDIFARLAAIDSTMAQTDLTREQVEYFGRTVELQAVGYALQHQGQIFSLAASTGWVPEFAVDQDGRWGVSDFLYSGIGQGGEGEAEYLKALAGVWEPLQAAAEASGLRGTGVQNILRTYLDSLSAAMGISITYEQVGAPGQRAFLNRGDRATARQTSTISTPEDDATVDAMTKDFWVPEEPSPNGN